MHSDTHEIDEFELMGLADEEVHAEDVSYHAEEIEDEGETCECIALSSSP